MLKNILRLGVTCLQLAVFISMSTMLLAQPTASWSYRFNGEGDYNDRYTCITSDAEGNIYLGGSTVNIGTDRDFLIQKIDASGNFIWRQEYSYEGNGPDEATAIVVDASQLVYVTGFGNSKDAGNDYLTMKLDVNGNISWIKTYNYSVTNQYDQANSIALDANLNVIVTGQSDADETGNNNDDYLTIKYSNAGDELWVVRYNGLGDAIDRAVKVVADASNNIYVTGRGNNGSDDDYVTIKYDTNGNQQWLKYGDRTNNDRAYALAIDASSNIYVTGRSSNGNNHDFYTIKYNSAGQQQWAQAYDHFDDDQALAICVDAASNVYVTGMSDGDAGAFLNYNIRTVKYNAAGQQQWTIEYDGAAGNDDIPTAIAVSGSNLFITGYSDANNTPVTSNDIITLDYSTAGTLTWSKPYSGVGGNDDSGNALIADAAGNVYVAGYEENSNHQRNALAIKYNNAGTQIFISTFDGIGDNSDNLHDIRVDADGNIYLSGYSVQRGNNRDFFSIKLNSNGDTLYTAFINGTSPDSEDEGLTCAIDATGNFVAAGFTKNAGTSGDYTIVKWNSFGDSLWLRFYDSPAHENDKAYDMQMDADGNFYITGRTDSDPTINSNDDATTVKFDMNTNFVWAKSYAGASGGADRGSILKISAAGNIFVAGRTFNGSNTDILLLKYNSGGVQQWAITYDGGVGNDIVNGMVVDANENVFLVGNSASANDTSDIITLKYDAAGNFGWEKRINNGGGDFGDAISLDPSSNIIVAATTDADNSAAVNLNSIAVKYDQAGNQTWLSTFNGIKNLDDISDAVTTDQFGNVYVACHTNNGTLTDINYDIETIRYNDDGSLEWQVGYNGISDTFDVANFIYVINNTLYVGGSSWENGKQRDMLLIKYDEVTGINQSTFNNNINIFPNPSVGDITVNSNISGELQFELFDVTGKKIFQTSFNSIQSTISFPKEITDGIYLCHVTQNNQIIYSEKLILQNKN